MNADDEKLIRKIVRETIAELKQTKMLRRADDVAYSEISSKLFEYYKGGTDDETLISTILRGLEKDEYFSILPMYYQQHITIDRIAELFDCEISTITRNKKRLCLAVYLSLTGGLQ